MSGKSNRPVCHHNLKRRPVMPPRRQLPTCMWSGRASSRVSSRSLWSLQSTTGVANLICGSFDLGRRRAKPALTESSPSGHGNRGIRGIHVNLNSVFIQPFYFFSATYISRDSFPSSRRLHVYTDHKKSCCPLKLSSGSCSSALYFARLSCQRQAYTCTLACNRIDPGDVEAGFPGTFIFTGTCR